MTTKFAVIDTETNWDNEVMSVGIVIADDRTFERIDQKYIIFIEAAKVGGMYSYALASKGQKHLLLDKNKGIFEIKKFLMGHDIDLIFAYNASFDFRCLPELSEYTWHDILRVAAYRQYNPAIPANLECCSTGRLKKGYGVEAILRLFGEQNYLEEHNALSDAIDELRIMKYLQYSVSKYPVL